MNEFTKGQSAVVYCRRSSDNEAQKESSIKEQENLSLKAAADFGLIIRGIYRESAKGDSNRPEFQKLKRDLLSGAVDAKFIIFEKRDRTDRRWCD